MDLVYGKCHVPKLLDGTGNGSHERVGVFRVGSSRSFLI
jgi:hypothetical protein